jgi:hypothetical protein
MSTNLQCCTYLNHFHLFPPAPSHSSHSDSLQAGQSGDRILVGARFSTSIQTGPLSLLYNGYCVFLGSKAARVWLDHPPPSGAEVNERVGLHLYSPSGPSWPVLGWILPLPFSGYRIPWGRDFPHLSRPALGPTQPTVRRVPGVESGRGVMLTPHPLLVPRSKNRVELYLCSP